MRATPRVKSNPKSIIKTNKNINNETAVSFEQLESSKENIQPLLRSAGKRMHSLAANLRQTPKQLTEKQERERRRWEQAIQMDKSSDPLALWLKYIKWTKLSFTCPTNQKAQLLTLIERCTRNFKDDSRYINNRKYIKIWLEYSHLSRDSMGIFKFMHANKIGHKVALFWRGWAIIAEQNNQYDLVDRIFTQAKLINAQPMKDINKAYDQFLARMRKKIANNDQDVINQIESQSNNNNDNYNKRATLGQLKNDKQTSHRTNHKQARGFGKDLSSKSSKNNNDDGNGTKKGGFGIYCDDGNDENQENNDPQNDGRYLRMSDDYNLPPVSSGWKQLESEYVRKKENNGIPSTWNNQGFGSKSTSNSSSNTSTQQRGQRNTSFNQRQPNNQHQSQSNQNTFAIPMDDEFKNKNKSGNGARGNGLVPRNMHSNQNQQQKIYDNPLHNYHNPAQAINPNEPLPTHMSRAMGTWTQQGRYLCAAFYDPKLLIDPITNKECSLEEARCRTMRPIWNRQMEDKEDGLNESGLEEDDMLMTMNVGRIVFNNKSNPDLSIPSTIKEEPSNIESKIQTDVTKNRENRKRKTSDEGLDELPREPSKKRFKFNHDNIKQHQHQLQQMQMNDDHTYDVFAELTTQTNYTSTIHSHMETPMRRLDFATPGSLMFSKQKGKLPNKSGQVLQDIQEHGHPHSQQHSRSHTAEATQDIGSMTAFFANPIKITDKRMMDTPTVANTKSKKFIQPTATVTFHSKAAMNDVIEMFGDGSNDNDQHNNNQNDVMMHQPQHIPQQNQNVESFGIYEDTATIHTKIDIGKIEIVDDEDIQDDLQMNEPEQEPNASPLPLPAVPEIEIDDEEEDEVKEVMLFDPMDKQLIMNHATKILQKYIENNHDNLGIVIYDERDNEPPVSTDDLLNGETDIELDEEDGFLNVTDHIKCISNGDKQIFFVNDLSQDEDCERMLIIESPLSLKAYHMTQILKQSLSTNNPYLSMEYAMVQSVYLYNNSSFTLSKITDSFITINNVLTKYKEDDKDLHEKLSLYYVTEIIRITSQLHDCNIIHSNLNLNSFLVKIGTASDINGDWTDNVGNGWENFGLLLNDLNSCIKLDEFIDFNNIKDGNNESFGCLINQNNLNNNSLMCIFQKLINNKAFCYEIDFFAILIIIIQLLTQNENIISEIQKMDNLNGNNLMEYIDKIREKQGLKKLENNSIWKKIIEMLLMNNYNEYEKVSIKERRNYLKECYKECSMELMDLENLSPKLQSIMCDITNLMTT